MTRWELDPPTIRSVVDAVEGDRDRLSRAVRPAHMETIQDGLAWGGPLLDPLRTAVLALTEQQADDLMTIRNHVAAGVLGMTNAVGAYKAGNEEMSAKLQRQMLRSADSGDFTYFIRHGLTG